VVSVKEISVITDIYITQTELLAMPLPLLSSTFHRAMLHVASSAVLSK